MKSEFINILDLFNEKTLNLILWHYYDEKFYMGDKILINKTIYEIVDVVKNSFLREYLFVDLKDGLLLRYYYKNIFDFWIVKNKTVYPLSVNLDNIQGKIFEYYDFN